MAAQCPVTRQQFREHAQDLTVEINGSPMLAQVKEFSTGSLGWYLNGKVAVPVGEKMVQVQVGVNLTIIGSKSLPKSPVEEPAEEPADEPDSEADDE